MTVLDALPHTSLMTAFLAGLLSVGSPCVLPVILAHVGIGYSARLNGRG
jgi:cytochrome c biogenesis protein CcdA